MNMTRLIVYLSIAAGATLCENTYAQTRTWNGSGSDDYWSTSNNWGGIAPVANDALIFGGTARCTNVNDLAADTAINGITFNSGSALFSLSGSRITLGGNVVNNDNDSHRLNFDMILNATRTFTATRGSMYLNGNVSGSGGANQGGANILVLAGTNSYQGPTTVSLIGIIRLLNDSALGTADAGTTVVSGGRLELGGGVTVTGEVVTINGNGGSNSSGALQVQNGSNTWAGGILLGSNDARIGVGAAAASGILVVSGVIDDGASTYNLGIRSVDNLGSVVLSGSNTYKGETKIVVGTLKLGGGDNRLPTNTVVRLGNGSNISFASFDLNGQNQTVAGITQDGADTWRWSITNSSASASTLTVNTRGSAYTCSSPLYGNINLTKGGTNTLTLSPNVNPFTGQTLVREGKLVVGGPWVLQDSTFNTGDSAMGVLSFGTNTVANFGGLVGTNDLVMTNSSGAAVSLRIRGSQTTSYDGRIVGGGDFTKTGAGTLTLKKAGSYTGKTFIVNGKLVIPSEDVLGVMPSGFVQDQITFDGGTLKTFSNFVFSADNRGVTLAAGGGTLEIPDVTNVFTVAKTFVGGGALTKRGAGVLTLVSSNAYVGVTTVAEGVMRITDNRALGSSLTGTVINLNCQLQLANGLTVAGEPITISGPGMTANVPASVPQSNRGALQADANAFAEWAGPMTLASGDSRVGAQDGGNLTISGVISGGAGNALRTSSNPGDRLRGTVLKGQNTYSGNTEITRGTVFIGATNTLPAASVLDVHWSNANNYDYAALDLSGFNQTVGGLKNTGDSGGNAVVTNSSATEATLTVNQAVTTDFGGVLAGKFAVVKSGAGSLSLTNRNFYSGTTTVSGGTLKIGVNNAIPTNTTLVLAGGAFDVGSKTNTVASLSLTASSSLALGTGKLTVTNQGADTWSGFLTLTGTLGPATLRFLPTLSADQLQCVRYNGRHVSINASGYISIYQGTLLRVN